MSKKIIVLIIILLFGLNFSMVSADVILKSNESDDKNNLSEYVFSDDYFIQWEMNFGSDEEYGARYEGPQPIGDCDNDGKNEMLIAGRDNKIRVFEWDEIKKTYLEMHTLFPPFYPASEADAGGFAIGDLDGDGKNEIGATWGTSVHKFINGKYKTIAFNPWIFNNYGGSADCYIGDYDNDDENELIVSGGSYHGSTVPEIVIYKLTAFGLVKEAVWDNLDQTYTYIYMPCVGDADNDGENEIVCGSAWKSIVLDWNENTKKFDETIMKITTQMDYPFACIIKDSDFDGKNEIHVGYMSPMVSIFEWNGEKYEIKFEKEWPGEESVIEGLDVGDVDDDGNPEVCAGTNVIHILQWNGTSYDEEAVLPTFGCLAVVSIGDCDNDGKNEINAGSVFKDHDEDFMSWVFKYGSPNNGKQARLGDGKLKVYVKKAIFGSSLEDASIAAWSLETQKWYDIQPGNDDKSVYSRWNLTEGEYYLRVLMEGYKIKETNITINAGQETVYTFSLENTHARYSNSNIFKKITDNLLNRFPIMLRLFQYLIK